MASRVFTFLVIFHVQVALGERDGALYCVVLFALRCFVTGWGLFLSGRLACLATCLCFHFRSWFAVRLQASASPLIQHRFLPLWKVFLCVRLNARSNTNRNKMNKTLDPPIERK